MKEEMFRRGYYFKPVKVTHAKRGAKVPANKEARILLILQPRYAAGYIIHTQPYPHLEAELLDYPLGKDAGSDCLAGVIALLDPFAASAAGDKDLSQDEFPPLEEVFESQKGVHDGDWRWA